MPRNIDSSLMAALSSGECWPVHLMQIQFRSQVSYAWSGIGSLVWAGKTFLGVGSVGTLGDIKEGTEVRADGTSVMLSGLDATYLAGCLTDIWLGAPAYRWLGAVIAGTRTLIGTPYPLFVGQVDKPTHHTGPDTMTINLALETKLINHTRASNRRLTTNDQRANGYPDDTGFVWVERLNDTALAWK
jgi:hypothetical protein